MTEIFKTALSHLKWVSKPRWKIENPFLWVPWDVAELSRIATSDLFQLLYMQSPCFQSYPPEEIVFFTMTKSAALRKVGKFRYCFCPCVITFLISSLGKALKMLSREKRSNISLWKSHSAQTAHRVRPRICFIISLWLWLPRLVLWGGFEPRTVLWQ